MDIPSFLVIPEDANPDRADRVLADCFRNLATRSQFTRLIRSGRVLLKGESLKPSSILQPGDRLEIQPEPASSQRVSKAVPDFRIIFEDDDLIVVDKPAGLVVHPAASCRSVTLMEALVETRLQMIGVGEENRWGIVHRLDKDTSGVMVAAKTVAAHASLAFQFKQHSVHRIYLALARATPSRDEGTIDIPLGRHVKDRKKISIHTRKARRAVTRWRVVERFEGLTLLAIAPQTGRTHQIRVHLASVGLPVAGDQVYGRAGKRVDTKMPHLRKALDQLKRQALHAAILGFRFPDDSQYLEFHSPLPDDMAEVIRSLRVTPQSGEA